MNNKLSYSAVEKYLQCSLQYYKYYIRNLREKYTGSALVFGNALDKGLNTLIETKNLQIAKAEYEKLMIDSEVNNQKVDLRTTDLVQYGNGDFDIDVLEKVQIDELELYTSQYDLKKYHQDLVQLKREKKLNGEALRHFNYMSWMSLKNKGLLFLEAYKEHVLPLIKRVIKVQEFLSLKNKEGDEFIGFIDLIAELNDGRLVIFDNKTTSSAYKEDSARTSKQLASYLGVLLELNHEAIRTFKDNIYVGYIVLNKTIRKKKEPRVNIQIIIDKIPEKLINSIFDDYDRVNNAIHNGHFEANYPQCASKYGKCFCKSELIYVPRKDRSF